MEGARIAAVPIGLLDLSGATFDSVTSGAGGLFRICAPSLKQIALTATFDGHDAARVGDIMSGKPIRLQLGSGGRRLSGRIVDRLGRSQANAEVRLALGLGGSGDIFLVRTNDAGYWCASVPDGDYLVHATTPGHESVTRLLNQGNDAPELVVEPRSSRVPPHSVTEWLRTAAIPLASVQPGGDKTDLAPIRKIIGDARVVGLGEVTHGTREVFQLKHRLVEYLVGELGFTVFAIEFGLPESIAIDDFVMGRGGNPEQLVAAQSAAVWRAQELVDLIRWMKDWNQQHERKVRFHGLDMRVGSGAAQEVFSYLRAVDEAVLSSQAAKDLAPLASPGTYRDALRRSNPELLQLTLQAKELAKLLDDRRGSYIEKSSQETWWRATMQARALSQTLEWRAAANPLAKVQVRERAMADNAMHLLDRYGPDGRAIIWAHNAHVSGDASAEPQMSGVHMRRRLGASYRVLGTLMYQGSYQASDESGRLRQYQVPPAPTGSIEAAIATSNHPIAALDLGVLPSSGEVADWFGEFRVMRQYDGLFDDERPEGWSDPAQMVARNYDALLFISNGTSARPIVNAGAGFR